MVAFSRRDLLSLSGALGFAALLGLPKLAGKRKPRAFGRVLNVVPVSGRGYETVYVVSSGPLEAIEAAYDGGEALAFAGDYPTSRALVRSSVPAGGYRTCLAEGLILVGALQASLTADAVGTVPMRVKFKPPTTWGAA